MYCDTLLIDKIFGKGNYKSHQRNVFEQLVDIMVQHDMAKGKAYSVVVEIRTNLFEYLEKNINE